MIQFYAHFSSGWRWPRSVLRMLKDRRHRRKGVWRRGRRGGEFVRNECACSWLVGDALRSVALRCDALLVKITSAQGIRFSGPSLSWPQGQRKRREEECVMEAKRNETKQNEMKWNAKCFYLFELRAARAMAVKEGEREREQANAFYTPQKATPFLSVSLALAAAASRMKRGERVKRARQRNEFR